jgi:hypothetical protein
VNGTASSSTQSLLGEIPQAYLGLLKAQASLAQEYFQALTGIESPPLTNPLAALQKGLPKPVCHVPPPCWMPRPLGECISYVAQCGKACVRLRVTNCDRTARSIQIRAEGAEGITVTPASLQLGPMQRATVEVCLSIPQDVGSGKTFESLIWVDGCRQHFLRWTVSVGTVGLDSCHEVAVDDCPDYRHHWYDHFYCLRPCNPSRSNQSG